MARSWAPLTDGGEQVHPAGNADYLLFPPGLRNVLIPLAPASVSARATMLYSPVRTVPMLAQLATWAVARAGAVRWLPLPRENWQPPLADDVFAELAAQWTGALGRPADGYAFYVRPQADRTGLVLLACAGPQTMVVRIRRDPADLAMEQRISVAARDNPPRTFHVPALRGHGNVGEWHWAGYDAISARPHRPATGAGEQLYDDITALVEAHVDRPSGTPAHWRGAHGDCTPWNLRSAAGHTWLFDWEDAGYAPPGVDHVYLHITAAAAGKRLPHQRTPLARYPEARDYWIRRLESRSASAREASVDAQLLALLKTASS